MGKGDDKEMDDATVVASPSFDAMLEARGEGLGEYDDQTARDAVKVHDDPAFAATAVSASYDARLDAMGLPIPEDIEPGAQAWSEEDKPGPDASVPKTMVLSPQQWGLPAQPPQQAATPQPQAYSPQPYSPQPQAYSPQPQPPYSPHAQHSPQAAAPQPAGARGMSSVTLFLISAAATLVVFGTCAAGVIAYLLMRS